MKRREQRPRPPSNLRNELRTYRNEHDLTQEQLSELLEVEARTLRRWENGETLVSDVYELNRIADCLGIPHERLGIVPPITVSREDLETGMQHSWELIQAGYISEARKVAETLVRRSQLSPLWEKKENLFVLARLYYAAAHATNLSVRTEDVDQAIYHYKQMEYFARASGDPSLMNTALVYLGDMYRRKGDVQRAIDYLEGAQTIPLLSPSALGNNLQLLARAYLRAERLQEFDTALKQSEAIAQEITQVDPEMQYHLTHVYEEYAKSFVALGKMQQALDAVELAEKYSPKRNQSRCF